MVLIKLLQANLFINVFKILKLFSLDSVTLIFKKDGSLTVLESTRTKNIFIEICISDLYEKKIIKKTHKISILLDNILKIIGSFNYKSEITLDVDESKDKAVIKYGKNIRHSLKLLNTDEYHEQMMKNISTAMEFDADNTIQLDFDLLNNINEQLKIYKDRILIDMTKDNIKLTSKDSCGGGECTYEINKDEEDNDFEIKNEMKLLYDGKIFEQLCKILKIINPESMVMNFNKQGRLLLNYDLDKSYVNILTSKIVCDSSFDDEEEYDEDSSDDEESETI